jgi:hypothetical protein
MRELFNLSFCFFHHENKQDLKANFPNLFEENTQTAIFENKWAKFNREIISFRMKKSKNQVSREGS